MRVPLFAPGLALAATLLAAAGCEKDDLPDLSTIIARHTEARGGAAALESVDSIEVNRRVIEGKREFTTHYVATRDGRMRLDVYQDGRRVFSEGYDGQSPWQQRGATASADEMPGWALAAVQRAVRHNLYGLHELEALGTKLELVGREKVSGLLHWVIEATDPDGYRRRLFVNPNSFLVTQVEERSAVNPDRSNYATDITTYFSDFRRVDGVLFSYKSETYSSESGVAEQKTDATDILVNPGFEVAIFTRPADKAGPTP